MDDLTRAKITAAFEQAATQLLACDTWRGHWRVEVDRCIFKFRIEGYPKHGSPRWQQQEDERRAAMAEWEAEQEKRR